MDAEGGVQARGGAGQREERRPALRTHGRHHDLRHPRRAGAGEHLGTVGVELGPVEVAVGVDHAIRRNSTPGSSSARITS
jgi:hypothetical protein